MTVVTSRVSWRSKKSTCHDPAHHPARLGSQDFLPDAHQPTPHDHSPILRGPGEQPPQLPAHPALRHATGQCAAPGNSTTRAQPAPSIAGEHGAGIQAPWKRCGNRVETDAPRTTLSPHSKAARSSAAFQSRRAVTPSRESVRHVRNASGAHRSPDLHKAPDLGAEAHSPCRSADTCAPGADQP